MCKMLEEMFVRMADEIRDDIREEVKCEVREEVIAEVRSEMAQFATKKWINNLVKKGKMTLEEIAECAGFSVEEVLRITTE